MYVYTYINVRIFYILLNNMMLYIHILCNLIYKIKLRKCKIHFCDLYLKVDTDIIF